jgi:hypothetical protein
MAFPVNYIAQSVAHVSRGADRFPYTPGSLGTTTEADSRSAAIRAAVAEIAIDEQVAPRLDAVAEDLQDSTDH